MKLKMTITYYYCQVCVRPLWLAPNLLFVLFCPVFALSMYICMLCVLICILVCLCVFLCVFPLEWNISCCIYAIYCTFYRTYVLVLQYLALYGIICLQLNSGYVKVALICPHNPILVFLSFPLVPCESPTGFFFCLRHCMGKFGALDKAGSTPPQCSVNALFNVAWLPYS